MKTIENDNGRAVVIKLERQDTLEEMAAMAALSLETLAERIESVIVESRNKEKIK